MPKKRKLCVVGDEYEPAFLKAENSDELKARQTADKDLKFLKDRDFGIDDENATFALRQDVARVMPDCAGLFHYSSRERHDAAFSMIEAMKPRNSMEALLAVHIMIAHNLAVDVAFQASFGSHIEPEERDAMLRSYQRLTNGMARLIQVQAKLQEIELKKPAPVEDRSDDTIFTEEQAEALFGKPWKAD